jgi:ATP/maltotriose-dependent transcriptional regulator MalT
VRAALDAEVTDSWSAEVMTQLARLESLRGDFDAANALVDGAEALAVGSAGAVSYLPAQPSTLSRDMTTARKWDCADVGKLAFTAAGR